MDLPGSKEVAYYYFFFIIKGQFFYRPLPVIHSNNSAHDKAIE